jgi:hypothetical protein
MHYQTTVATRQPLAASSLLRLKTATWLPQCGERKRVKTLCRRRWSGDVSRFHPRACGLNVIGLTLKAACVIPVTGRLTFADGGGLLRTI